MRKLVTLFLIGILFLILLGNSKATNEGIYLRDYPASSILKDILQLNHSSIMNDIIILPEEKFDEEEAASIIATIQQLPPSLLAKVEKKEIAIKLFVGKLTDNPTANHLKGIIPRGYTSEKKWDDVPGIGGGQFVLVKIGHSQRGMGHGAINLELHELAHSIDRIVFNKLRFDPVFLNIWTKEKYALFQNQTYLATLPEEYFAEAFAMFYLNKESRKLLKEKAPATYEYIKNLK